MRALTHNTLEQSFAGLLHWLTGVVVYVVNVMMVVVVVVENHTPISPTPGNT